MNKKTIQCLPNPSQHIPIYLEQFPSYSNRKCKKSPFSRTAAHIFVSPKDAPGVITLNVVWMEREFDAYKLSRSMYPSIFNSFSLIRTASSKNRHPAHIFVSPGDAPTIITQYVAWMERKFNGCQFSRSMYLSIFNSFRVIRWLSQCVSPKIAILPHFCFPWGRPWVITLNVVRMEREFDAYKLSRCKCRSNYNRFWDTARYLWKKSSFYHTPLHSTPLLEGSRRNIGTPLVWKN